MPVMGELIATVAYLVALFFLLILAYKAGYDRGVQVKQKRRR